MEIYPAVAESNIEKLRAQLSDVLIVRDTKVLEAPDRVVWFGGQLVRDAESAYAAVRERFRSLGYTPLLQRQGDSEVIIAQQGIVVARPSQAWINVALFAATFLSVLFTGALSQVGGAVFQHPTLLVRGLPYALTLMSILLSHEMGHYIVGRRYNAPVSLPYFIPLPLLELFGLLNFGTMGAVIVQRAPFEDRRSLFDIGVAGPLAGLVVALPLLVYGLATSPVGPITHPALMEGNSILYLAIKFLLFGRILPSHGIDVMLNPVAWAAWVGLFVTMLNLLPIGQLDGGHTLYALLGKRAWLVAFGIVGLLVVMGVFVWNGWLIWAALVLFFGVRHPAPLNDLTPMGWKRNLLGLGVLTLFVLIFTPVPFTVLP